MPTRYKGQVAVITGAAQGIGAALALDLARRGCDLALADVDSVSLAATAATARAAGVKVSEHRLDVSDAAAVANFPVAVLEQHGRANLLFNNAGVALMGTFEQVSLEEFEWLLGINLFGVVRMTKAFGLTRSGAPLHHFHSFRHEDKVKSVGARFWKCLV